VKLKFCIASLLLLVSANLALPQAKTPPETRNAALRYWMAFAEMQDPPGDATTQALLAKTAAGEAAWDEKNLGSILDANSEAIGIMQRATKLPECDWGLAYSEGPKASVIYGTRARALARLNTLEGIREMANGNSQGAVEAWLAGVRFSEHLANGGPVIFTLIAKSMLLSNLHAISIAAKQGHLDDLQRKQVSVRLKQMPEAGFDWGAAWGLEASAGEQFLKELASAKNPETTYEKLAGGPMPSGAKAPSAEDIRSYREYTNAVRSALDMPPDTAKLKLSDLESKRRTLPQIAQNTIPNALKINEARAAVVAARKELLGAISGN
jgi:hypothetical protein